MLEAGRGREVRFDFQARPGDSASFRFDATSGPDADAVALALPLKPAFHPRSYTVAGVLHDTASAELLLPADIDPARSTAAVEPRHLAARHDPRRQAVASDLSLLVLRAGGERRGAPGGAGAGGIAPGRFHARARRPHRAGPRGGHAEPAAAERRRHRSLERHRLDHAVAHRLRRRRAARCPGSRPRRGRLGARPAWRLPQAVAGPEPARRRTGGALVRQRSGCA